jgi:hypothetical protein
MRIAASLIAALIAVTAPATAVEWTMAKYDALGFSASFPAPPQSEQSVEQGVKLTTIVSAVPEVMCLVVVGDYPAIASADGELESSRDSFLKGVNATLSSQHRIEFPRGTVQLPALAFDSASATHRFNSIIVIDKLRVYQVLAGVPQNGGVQEHSDRCVNGFKLTP